MYEIIKQQAGFGSAGLLGPPCVAMLSLCVYGKWAAACLRDLGPPYPGPPFLPTQADNWLPRHARLIPPAPFTALLYMESVPPV